MNRASVRLQSVEGFVGRLPFPVFFLLLTLLALVKHGVRLESPFDFRIAQPPDPLTWIQSPYLLIVDLTKGNSLVFHITAFIIGVGVLLLSALLLKRRLPPDTFRVSVVIIMLGPIGLSLIHQIAKDDAWLLLGASILVLTSNRAWPLWTLGALLMSSGNSAQAVVGVSGLLVLSSIAPFRAFRTRAAVAAVVAISWLLMESALGTSDQMSSFSSLVRDSIMASINEGFLRIYSIYGAFWLIVLLVLVHLRSREIPPAIFALIILPLAITLLTLDGWRVGVAITAPMLFAVIRTYLPAFVKSFQTRLGPWPTTAALVVLLVLPTLAVGSSQVTTGHFTLPGSWILNLVSK